MSEGKVVVISPPFFSHFRPLLTLSLAFQEAGWSTRVACSRDFEPQIRGAGLGFVELVISRNANTGVAEDTEQPEEERRRIKAFLDSTRQGPLETLILQAEHRKLDMLFEPEYLAEQIREIQGAEAADLYVVDQLSYGVTIALYLIGLPFVSFCPAHPYSIPVDDILYGVPPVWPEVFAGDPPVLDVEMIGRLRRLSVQVEEHFTAEFNRVLRRSGPELDPVENAFRFTSELAVLYNYPEFAPGRTIAGSRPVFMGSCFREETLPGEWERILEGQKSRTPRVLIALGTFLSARSDVVARCIRGVLKACPDALVIAGAGAREQALADLPDDRVLIRAFVPQIALLPQVDLFVHHGGNNSFTESLYYGVPTILLPFSSDQFNVARDAESERIARVLDPNRFSESQMAETVRSTLEDDNEAVGRWSRWVRERGAGYGVRSLECILDAPAGAQGAGA